MNFREINIVSKALPPQPLPAILDAPGPKGEERLECPFDEDEIIRVVRSYSEVNFAWKAASILAKQNCILPIFPSGNDKWFYRCWLLLKDPKGPNQHNEAYDPIREAWTFDQMEKNRPTKELLRALLLCTGATHARVAQKMGVDLEVVEAYECLFFNVIDRKADSLFLRNLVYPDTKMEEMVKGYFEKANLGRVLLRMGYNHTMEDVAHFAGMRQDSYREGVTEAQAFSDFQQHTMANGCILAATGFLNYYHPVAGLTAAKSLSTASKIGGAETGGGSADDMQEFHTMARNILDRQRDQVQLQIAEKRAAR